MMLYPFYYYFPSVLCFRHYAARNIRCIPKRKVIKLNSHHFEHGTNLGAFAVG